ncbi:MULTISPECIES: alpha/beta fold hydrolase [unclassified Rhizobium]|uniref:alpha/beta hydrolase family protein n=1 Tax=unclassified Rhizobium TaxID=2613769 RepID=UPI000EA8CB7E|nr:MULTISPECIES: alpha/beta fold hydrolase [unclassified Rhizobium]AYG69530.1 alpha/beta fold hydrolase [Rhizobium sp. CCGE531]AYG75910.1 alpha/beta fold hydrolase [Rhizobium sp. CCGE532]
MSEQAIPSTGASSLPISIPCRDGVVLGGHLWLTSTHRPIGSVIINPATGVLARYYHRYAQFLAGHGFDVLTYDYRGIGQSRPQRMRGSGYRWRDWGERDFDAALLLMADHRRNGPLMVVGHSVGGFLPGLAESAPMIDRMLTVGAQYAWWGDYMPRRRAALFLKWHVAMPAITAFCGYFPGRRLGWLEDLPKGVANEWSFRGRRFERSHPKAEREIALHRMAAVKAPILAVAVSDDELGTMPAIHRTLRYYTSAQRMSVLLKPADFGRDAIGHFGLFHDRHASGFWIDTLSWLREGRNPWPASASSVGSK